MVETLYHHNVDKLFGTWRLLMSFNPQIVEVEGCYEKDKDGLALQGKIKTSSQGASESHPRRQLLSYTYWRLSLPVMNQNNT